MLHVQDRRDRGRCPQSQALSSCPRGRPALHSLPQTFLHSRNPLGLGTQSRLGCRSDTGKPPPQLASRGRVDGHAGGPFQVIFIHASPAPAQGHRREDTLLAEVGSYLPHRCPPPVRLYSRLTGLHNRQTAPDGRLAPAPAACSLPRARTEETRGP
jgi:hypothetical protein